jgi:hypothetical protein
MTIKIKSWKMRAWDDDNCKVQWHRVVLESDWRKLMRLVKACEAHAADEENIDLHWMDAVAALDALEKKK